MSLAGNILLALSFFACLISLGCLSLGHLWRRRAQVRAAKTAVLGHIFLGVCVLLLTAAVVLLAMAFMGEEISLDYVLRNRYRGSDEAWFYNLAGLWAGRAGSLLIWAWLLGLMGAALMIGLRIKKSMTPMDNGAFAVIALVMLGLLALMVFSSANNPFMPMDYHYSDGNQGLIPSASVLGMSMLLEHWAMVTHPPALLLANAALTIPFAYAIAAAVVNDASDLWVRRATPWLHLGWLCLIIGLFLGTLWAYEIVGWGGYWGWDPVETSTLPLVFFSLMTLHSFSNYQRRKTMKRWSLMGACLLFAGVCFSALMARGGLVTSVHSFGFDFPSLLVFACLALIAEVLGLGAIILRWKNLAPKPGAVKSFGKMASGFAQANQGILLIFALGTAYLSLAPALPEGLPMAGAAVPASTCEALVRPIAIAYGAFLIACGVGAYGAVSSAEKPLKVVLRPPLIAAALGFCGLMVVFFVLLLPNYYRALDGGGAQGETVLGFGSPIYYNGLALVGFAVAALLFFISLFRLGNLAVPKDSGFRAWLPSLSSIGSHGAFALLLVGLIGSGMYSLSSQESVVFDGSSGEASDSFSVGDFTLSYTGIDVESHESSGVLTQRVYFDVYPASPGEDSEPLGEVSPALKVQPDANQRKPEPSFYSGPAQDLMVVYLGMDTAGLLSLTTSIYPLVGFVWLGALLLLGSALGGLFGRQPKAMAHGVHGIDARQASLQAPRLSAPLALPAFVEVREDTKVSEVPDKSQAPEIPEIPESVSLKVPVEVIPEEDTLVPPPEPDPMDEAIKAFWDRQPGILFGNDSED